MNDGKVRVVTPVVDRQRPMFHMVPLFMFAVALGLILEMSLYESLTFAEFKLAISKLPQRWIHKNHIQSFNFDVNSGENVEDSDKNGGRVQQSDNEKLLPLWEQPTLLNLNPFSWVMNNESLCKLGLGQTPENTRLMPVLVHTARSHFDERLALRRSWGSVPIYKKWDVRLVFLLGEADRGTNPEVNEDKFQEQEKQLKEEEYKYGDIVIGSFIDTYHNLTYKHIMGYKWVLSFCKKASFVLKIDDDMFIDILRWCDWRSGDFDKIDKNSSATIPDLYCHTFGGKPIRHKGSKWYASEEDWPDKFYPGYCSGWAYGITVEFLKKLYTVSGDVKFFWIDDVFATGVLREAAQKKYEWKPEIKKIGGNVTSNKKDYRPLCESDSLSGKREFRAVAYVPRGKLFERDMMCMWNKTLYDSAYNFTQ